MSTFQPTVGMRAQVEHTRITDGRFYVTIDSREILFDYGGERFVLSSGPFDEDSLPLSTRPAVLFAVNGVVRSIPMGAEGEVLMVHDGSLAWGVPGSSSVSLADYSTTYSVMASTVGASPSLSGGGSASGGLVNVLSPAESIFSPSQSTEYQIFK